MRKRPPEKQKLGTDVAKLSAILEKYLIFGLNYVKFV